MSVVIILQKFINDPYTATWGGFAKVTSFLQKTLLHDSSDDLSPDKETVAEMLQDDELTGMKINNQEEPGFEVVTTVNIMFIF